MKKKNENVFCFRHYFIMRCQVLILHLPQSIMAFCILFFILSFGNPFCSGYSLMITGIADLSPFLIVSEMKRN